MFAEGFFFDAGDEVLGDLVVDVGIQKREANFSHGLGDVGFGDVALAAEVFENVLEFVGKAIEHGGCGSLKMWNVKMDFARRWAAREMGGGLAWDVCAGL